MVAIAVGIALFEAIQSPPAHRSPMDGVEFVAIVRPVGEAGPEERRVLSTDGIHKEVFRDFSVDVVASSVALDSSRIMLLELDASPAR
ncbi:MAG TPA: hypothetical protein VMI31_06840, partial [Fimbriimonadaceae bacterium]|nr:hypothetical protein [Fimbriimonadaceae bacterium]